MTELRLRTSTKRELVDITAEVATVVEKSGLAEGLCHVYVAHATAAIVVNENDDPNVCVDLLDALDRLIPAGIWRHDRVDGNAAAHINGKNPVLIARPRAKAPSRTSRCADR